MEASITLKSIAKTFNNHTLLADLSFGVEKGTSFALIGGNASGKSTILKLLVGIVEKDAGIAYINGKDIKNRSDEIRSVTGYMSQNIDLDDDLSVLENLIISSRLHGLSPKMAKNNSMYYLEALDIIHLANLNPLNISYGDQRKIMFIRSIVHDPEVILLDEPTKGLDPHARNKIWDIIDKFTPRKTILFSTQNLEEAEKYADRIAILYNGNIKMDGTLDRLIETTHGLSRYVLSFSEPPPRDFFEQIKKNPRILKPSLNGLDFEFYSREKKQFFNAMNIALQFSLNDIELSSCKLRDLFIGLTDGGLE